MIYNKITKEVYIDKPERVKPNSFSNHNTDKSNIHVAKLMQEIQRKNAEQEACWELQEIISESQNRTENKGLLDKSIEEDEVKEEHVKLAPG